MRNGSFSGTGPLLIQSLSINYGMLRELTEPLPRIVRLYVASISVLPGVPKVLLRRSYFLFPPSSMYGGGRLRGRLWSIKNVPGGCCPRGPPAEQTGGVQSRPCASAQRQLSWKHNKASPTVQNICFSETVTDLLKSLLI